MRKNNNLNQLMQELKNLQIFIIKVSKKKINFRNKSKNQN